MHRRAPLFKEAAVSREASSVNDPRLVESEQRYQAVIENASDMIQSVRPDGSFEFVNRSWLTKLGYDRAEVDTMGIWQIVHPDSVPHCQPYFEQALRGETVGHVETVFVTKGGVPVPVEGNVTPRLREDVVVATHGFFRDITERRRAEELERRNVRLEHERQARYLEKMAALGKLAAGLAHEFNNPSAAIQVAIRRLKQGLAERDASADELLRAGAGPETWNAIDVLLRGADNTYTGEYRLDPLGASNREGALESWLDDRGIDDAWQMAPELVHASIDVAQLERLSDALSTALLPAALRWACADLTVRETSEVMSRSSDRISKLVEAVKGYTHMDRALEHDADVHAGLEDTLIMLRHQLGHRKVHITRGDDVPRVRAVGSALNQVWTNLLDNAIDATSDDGHIAVRTFRDGTNVTVEIEDDGPGIAPEQMTRIFEPFFTTKPQGTGTGLGLDTAWRIVTEEHGGTISAESAPGRTVFRVTVPAAAGMEG
jgi:PAS domain S-box-containing protein